MICNRISNAYRFGNSYSKFGQILEIKNCPGPFLGTPGEFSKFLVSEFNSHYL